MRYEFVIPAFVISTFLGSLQTCRTRYNRLFPVNRIAVYQRPRV